MVDQIHNFSRQLEAIENRLKVEKDLSKTNRKRLLNFSEYLLASGTSKGRVVKYLSHLIHLTRILGKDLNKATQQDLVRIVRTIFKAINLLLTLWF